jgi:peptidoglycan-associated lipoprotein
MKTLSKAMIVAISVVLLAACGTTGSKRASTGGADRGVTEVEVGGGGTAGGGAESMGIQGSGEFAGERLDDPSSILAKRVIYFDFDSSDIKDEYRDIIKAHATYLANHPNASIVLEGHADERGSREYNIGLGERRAKAVSRFLTLQGASSSQVETISYGEERPVAFGHDESSWKLNRRVEIVYQGG